MTILENNIRAGKRALLIEPEDATRRALQLLLQGWRFEVRSYCAAAAALSDAFADDADVLLVAHCLPEGDGSAALNTLRGRGWKGQAILIADSGSRALAAEARQAGFTAVLDRPVGRLDLLEALRR